MCHKTLATNAEDGDSVISHSRRNILGNIEQLDHMKTVAMSILAHMKTVARSIEQPWNMSAC